MPKFTDHVTNLLDSLEAISRMEPRPNKNWKTAKDALCQMASNATTTYEHVYKWIEREFQPKVGSYVRLWQWNDLILLAINDNPRLRSAYQRALRQVKKKRKL